MVTKQNAFLTVENIDIYYELIVNKQAQNSSFTIVLLHGSLSSTFCYRKLIPYFEKDYNIVNIDLPPFGKSEKSRTFKYTYKNLAMLVIESVKKLGFTSCIVVGHSMGGQIALMAGQKEQQLVKGIVLLSSSGYMPRFKKSFILATYIPFFSFAIKRYLERQGVASNLLKVVHDQKMIDDEMIKGYEEPFHDRKIFFPLLRLIRYREGDLTPEELKQIHTPTLLIWGKHDRIVPVRIGKQLHEDLPNSKFIVYEKTGHLVPEERPDLVYRDIQVFLESLPALI
ncbi:alpha/beta fold hydrolase [Bacillus sp. Marseille-P3661]|uniref:alpha/beta fold hydrolase n=1 Tax=Bacillus sp. Marseille-P3661 TaxID=1936234 RepID=UPI000C84529B|nr:alpha/beta hydrolase [Bacillus sp. Marseille-P3661]